MVNPRPRKHGITYEAWMEFWKDEFEEMDLTDFVESCRRHIKKPPNAKTISKETLEYWVEVGKRLGFANVSAKQAQAEHRTLRKDERLWGNVDLLI